MLAIVEPKGTQLPDIGFPTDTGLRLRRRLRM